MLTQEQYIQVLHGLELQLWRHADPWGNLTGESIVQKLRESWESLARSFVEDYPDSRAPVPFWRLRKQPILCVLRLDRDRDRSGDKPDVQGRSSGSET